MGIGYDNSSMDPHDEEYTEQNKLLEAAGDGEASYLDEADLYESTVSSCGFGKFQIILLFVCGWAIASDSVEIQVVSFVLPSACDLELTSWEKGWLNSIIFIGMMIGGYVFGGAADIAGRRFILIISMTINGLFGLASAFAPSFPSFLVLRLFSGIGVGAAMPVLFSYYVEFMNKSRRGPMIGFLASFWMCGNILTSGIAWLIIPQVSIGGDIHNLWFGSWRIFVALCAFPSLSSALFIFIMPESPKYLQKIGEDRKATRVFTQMFHMNYGSSVPIPIEIKEFSANYRESASHQTESGERADDPDACCFCNLWMRFMRTMVQVLQSTIQLFQKELRNPTLILLIVWFTLSFGYYGLWMWFPEIFRRIQHGGSSCGGETGVNVTQSNLTCLETVAQEKDVYLESFLVAVSNLPGNIVTILVINMIGRRQLLALSMLLSSVSVFFIWLVTTRVEMVIMSCVFSGISVAGWNALDALALENYPTHLRSTAFGVQAGIGRIAAVLGNVVFGELVDVHCSIPLILVASFLAAGGLSVLKLRKTDDSSLN